MAIEKYDDLKKYVREDIPLMFNEINVLKKHFSRVINVYEGNILPPYEILIHPSSVCNLNCKWCIGGFVSSKKNKDELLPNNLFNVDNMNKVVDSIINYKKIGYDYETNTEKEFKVENVSFSGITGEPFVANKSLLSALNKLCDAGIKTGIFTNGVLIKEDMFDTLIKLKYLLISVDAGNATTYSKLKCDNKDFQTFDELLETMEKLIKYKNKKKSKLEVNVGYIINQFNYNQLYDLAVKLKKIGVHYLRFKTDIASLLNMNTDQRIESRKQIDKIKAELCDDKFDVVEIHNVLDDRSKQRLHTKCFVHYLIGNISADGNVYPCNYHPKKNGIYYDSAITNSFENVWENIMNYDADKDIPNICPPVCDPFKNRTNLLLEKAYEVYKEKGLDYLKKCIDNIEVK